MTAYTPLNSLPYPQSTDTADVPLHFRSLAEAVDSRTVMRFTNATARDAQITTPVAGMVAWLDDIHQLTHHTGTVWAPVAPVPVFLFNNDAGTTTSTTPNETLTSATGDPLVAAFVAPPTGRVIVTVGAMMFNSTATTCYMGATIKKVSDGSVFLTSTIDRCAMLLSTDRVSTSSQFLVSGLTAGTAYSATPTYWSAVPTSTNTASYDNRFIRVDPVL
ncbi:hypothetical protein ACSCB1_20175 [Streptomyces europaeiscabiei]|uniref:Uncharacterized protein n=1 Tax=Streptomyces europaeiscabiei TaxID=146819 RepID=A0ABU4NC81_9ACTN|nr:hypothetical protein [Streptomyces europaeiscabiei]MDX2526585.1 hypothetical protein [Streptomyces europaeiscabiei]MDX2759334.1 hypothetical protein [Streptomyces europaeiscabiei]MDX2773587.1 hypothetical protein [Streptomyces europaeiscabiei]MDX3541657.1 hypothetical protein [Streptomyces europaeiscabiei]MDX3551998.1 hypothetical protein [Streptomyces europaeiscabiei]